MKKINLILIIGLLFVSAGSIKAAENIKTPSNPNNHSMTVMQTIPEPQILKGIYFSPAHLGGGIYFKPEDPEILGSEDQFIGPTNSSTALYELFNITKKYDENCADFYGNTLIEVRDLKKMGSFNAWTAEIVEVIKKDKPTCDIGPKN